MPGGELSIRKGPDGNLIQQGPAQRVYRAEVELGDLEGHDSGVRHPRGMRKAAAASCAGRHSLSLGRFPSL